MLIVSYYTNALLSINGAITLWNRIVRQCFWRLWRLHWNSWLHHRKQICLPILTRYFVLRSWCCRINPPHLLANKTGSILGFVCVVVWVYCIVLVVYCSILILLS